MAEDERHQRLMPQLLGLMAAQAAKVADEPWPDAADAAVALQQAANPGSFEFGVDGFSFEAGDREFCSPWTWAAGVQWCLRIKCITEDGGFFVTRELS